jgi:hypothetical protein
LIFDHGEGFKITIRDALRAALSGSTGMLTWFGELAAPGSIAQGTCLFKRIADRNRKIATAFRGPFPSGRKHATRCHHRLVAKMHELQIIACPLGNAVVERMIVGDVGRSADMPIPACLRTA